MRKSSAVLALLASAGLAVSVSACNDKKPVRPSEVSTSPSVSESEGINPSPSRSHWVSPSPSKHRTVSPSKAHTTSPADDDDIAGSSPPSKTGVRHVSPSVVLTFRTDVP